MGSHDLPTDDSPLSTCRTFMRQAAALGLNLPATGNVAPLASFNDDDCPDDPPISPVAIRSDHRASPYPTAITAPERVPALAARSVVSA